MQQFKMLIRIAIIGIVINGVSQALISYAVVPGKYDKESYTAEEVRRIAYRERAAGIDSLYKHSYVNGMLFLSLGLLFVVDMWLSNKIKSTA